MAGRPGDRIAQEQAALRRVATLVARGMPPEDVFAAVTEEVGRLLDADLTAMGRYEPDETVTSVGRWSATGGDFDVRRRVALGGRNVTTLVFQTGWPARLDDYSEGSGAPADVVRSWGGRSSVGAPVSVEGRLWGVIVAVSSREALLPADSEARLAGFTELAATAIANAQARLELRGFAEEQAALRRVASLVARGVPPEEVFAAVTVEVGGVLDADHTAMSRYDLDGAVTVVGSWARTGLAVPVPVGHRLELSGRNVTTLVFESGRPVRIDRLDEDAGPALRPALDAGMCTAVGAPIRVAGRLWGAMIVASAKEPLPAGTETRLAGFTELVATAVANAQAGLELRGFAEEQAALRRVATLVAQASPPEEVFAAVTAEVGRVLDVEAVSMNRYDPDGAVTVVGRWGIAGSPVGTRAPLGGRNVLTMVSETGRAARIDGYGVNASGPVADLARGFGARSLVGVPISVEGRLWGVMAIASMRQESLPADTEGRLAGFTELAGTAIANAEAHAALTASRARIVATADETRRRIERNLHDGAQQALVNLALRLRTAQARVPPGASGLAEQLDEVAAGLDEVLNELRDIARGIHPAVLADGGLRSALKALARRSALTVHLDVHVHGRLPEPIELAAYYGVAEALTNTAKHAQASYVDVDVAAKDGILRVRVRDDGRGGADVTAGSGLVGLTDRVEALGGRISLHSPPGAGTTVEMALPLDERGRQPRRRRHLSTG